MITASMSDKQKFNATISWYNNNAQQYIDQINNSPEKELLNRFVSKLKSGGTILDAGSAGGRDTHIFKLKGFEPIGIDIAQSFVELASKKYPDLTFVYGSFLNLPFEDKYFDGIWAHASLLHFESTEEVEKSLQEFYRVMKLGGILHVFVKQQIGKDSIQEVAHQYSGQFKRFFRFFKKEEINYLLEKSGFKIIDITDNYVPSDGRSGIKWIVALAKKSNG